MKKDEDILKHKILGLLTKPILDHYEKDSNIEAKPFERIEKELKINRRKLWEVATELIENKEIVYYDLEFTGFLGTDQGISSYVSKKYFYRNRDRKRENIKFYIGVTIPIISLLIALVTIIAKIDFNNSKIDQRLDRLEKAMQPVVKQPKIIKNGTDSSSIKVK